MTICNMTIEGGARAGLIAPDEKIFEYLKGKPMSPKGEKWDKALENWKSLKSDDNANFEKEISLQANEIIPMITWGTSPQDVITIDGKVPNPNTEKDNRRFALQSIRLQSGSVKKSCVHTCSTPCGGGGNWPRRDT